VLRNKIYYRLKPFIPQSLRAAVRRRLASRLRNRVGHVWPIMPGSERRPDGWPGWPNGKRFALVLTHDVEGLTGLNNCRQLMQLELDAGFRSSFNFVPEGKYRVSAQLRHELSCDGFEVGIHDLKHDGRLYECRREFAQSATRINDYIQQWGAAGFRSGFMLHELDWLHDLDIRYDASTFDTDPFEPQPEGRNTVFPFWVPRPRDEAFRLAGDRARRGYVELPYTLPQDSTLFLLLREQTIDIWRRKVDWIAEHGGMVLLDTHPDYMVFDSSDRPSTAYRADLYKQFLEYVKSTYSGEYWHALPRQVADHILDVRRRATSSHTAFNPTFGGLLESLPHHVSLPGDVRMPAVSRSVPSDTVCRDLESISNGVEKAVTIRPGSNGNGETWNKTKQFHGRRAAVLLFSHYPADPRPRRAAEALAAEGMAIDVICLQESPTDARHERINGVNVFRVPLKRHRGSKMSYVGQYSAFILTAFVCLACRSLTRRYNLVHVHNMPDVLVFSALVPKMLGTKVILDLHDPMPELMETIFKLRADSMSVRLLKQLEKWSISFADSVLTVNLACKKIYSSRSCRPEKINVVLNSPDDEIFQFRAPTLRAVNGKRSNGSFVILYHGSLVRRNGFDLALEALERLSGSIPDVRLRVCGQQTAYFDSVMKVAEESGLKERIDYLGARSIEQIVDDIDTCHLGIIPNHRNIFTEINTPTRIFEYLALGKPVIAPRAEGIQDYFGDRDLLFFKLGDASDLAERIEFAYNHPQEVDEIVKRGQAVYQAHTWRHERSILLQTVSKLL